MSKKKEVKKISDASVEELMPKSVTIEGEEVKLETKKSYLKQADKLVRRMDRVLTDMHTLSVDLINFYAGVDTTEMTQKDNERFAEIKSVVCSTEEILFQLTKRMARKYVGKEIDDTPDRNRKSLKK